MEDAETPDPDYIKGFNEGYTMTKYMSELATKLAPAINHSLRGAGFQDGMNELIQEKVKEKYPAWLKNDIGRDIVNSPDKELDKDIDE